MIGERTSNGWMLELRPRGAARHAGTLLLGLWLCGWAVGEAFALGILAKGVAALWTGTGMKPGSEPLELAEALLVGGFLLVWLTFWTVGGIAAIAAMLRELWGEDTILVGSGRLVLTRRYGPFHSTRTFERDTIRRVLVAGTGDKLMLEIAGGRVELSDLGTRSERAQGAEALVAELGLRADPAPGDATLPPGWEDIITPEGERALVPDRAIRHRQAQVAGVAGLLAAALSTVFMLRVPGQPDMLVPAAIVAALTAGIAAGVLWLARGRWEWRIGSGRLTLRKRYGSDVRDVFEARRLVIETSSDSDGDRWYEVVAIAEPHEDVAAGRTRPAKIRRTVARRIHDAFAMRQLAQWLAQVSGLPLDDLATPAAREADVAEQLRRLEQSGWLGRQVAKLVGRVVEGRARR